MQPDMPLTCQSCGTVVSALGGRCPNCGVMLEEVQQLQPPPPRIMSRPTPPKPAASPMTLAVGAMAGVVALVAIVAVIWQATRDAEEPSPIAAVVAAAPARSAAPGPITSELDVGLELGKAKAAALDWDPDATLARIELMGVEGAAPDVNAGASLRFEFAKPGGDKLGQGAPLGQERFVYTITASGARSESTTRDAAALGVGDPLCFDVVQAARAAGADEQQPLDVSFAFDAERNRAIWSVRTGKAERPSHVLDGRTCAIVLR